MVTILTQLSNIENGLKYNVLTPEKMVFDLTSDQPIVTQFTQFSNTHRDLERFQQKIVIRLSSRWWLRSVASEWKPQNQRK